MSASYVSGIRNCFYGRYKKQKADKYKGITNDRNYDTRSTLTSLRISGLDSFKRLIFVAPCVREQICKFDVRN
jgi:hypothetical protein